MPEELTLFCPIRGRLSTPARSADGLSPSEEKFRIDAINHLIAKGYPPTHIKIEATVLRFGSAGRNSLRADFAVLDISIDAIAHGDIEELLRHAIVLGEVKRDNAGAQAAKRTQVLPMLNSASRDDCVALYWDDLEQRVFWRELVKGVREPRQGPLNLLPNYGSTVVVAPLTLTTIAPTSSLRGIYSRIEDILHAGSVELARRYTVILQLLLAKLYDENNSQPEAALALQDFKAMGVSPRVASDRLNSLLARAVRYYQPYLPNDIETTLSLPEGTLTDVLELLAPVKITASKISVVQDFYMKFAKDLYRWDLAQYFTPPDVSGFIVSMLGPGPTEHIKDPACGSADFLASAFRRLRSANPRYADCVWGADNSENAVQVAVLNMLLNGDAKSNIKCEDSLSEVDHHRNKLDIVVCNPPFGVNILERRPEVLANYELGHEWPLDTSNGTRTMGTVLPRQQAGILFVECCVRQVKASGRIGIILPNGYLGNRGPTYLTLRHWLTRQCKIVSIVGFPRFTFKTSGADVSASVLFLEKRPQPLAVPTDDLNYPIHFAMLDRVGWRLGDKGGEPIYQRDQLDGAYIIDATGERLLDADFDRVLKEARASQAGAQFQWLAGDATGGGSGWSMPAEVVLAEPSICLDPKRYSHKPRKVIESIVAQPHFRLADVVDVIPQGPPTSSREAAQLYRYVELEDIGIGEYESTTLRGWQLPDRARLEARPGDIFIGSIWSSVRKWCLASGDCEDLLVTNGCYRLRIKPSQERLLPDIVAGLCSEAYRTQMRALARGSDGLAEIWEGDLLSVVFPKLSSAARKQLAPYVTNLREGRTTLSRVVTHMIASGAVSIPSLPERAHHSALV